MSPSRWFLLAWLGVISGTTLLPLHADKQAPAFFCVWCGDGAGADAVLNAALFLPLGVALSLEGWRALRALALGSGLSLGIELAQFVIPGRDPSVSDVLFNTVGTALGIALVRTSAGWRRPSSRLASVLAVSGALVATVILALTAFSLGPSLPDDAYYGGWTPKFGHLAWYGGRITEAAIDGLEIRDGRIARESDVRERLLDRATIVVLGRAGPPPPRLAPLLTIHDRHQREILLLGADGEDLVYRQRTRAIAWSFAAPAIRFRGALRRTRPEAPLSIVVRHLGREYCMRVDVVERCGLGYTMGEGWTLLLGREPIPIQLHPILAMLWLAALLVPVGLWLRFSWPGAAAVALVLAALLIGPRLVGVLDTPGSEVASALAGLLAGAVVGRAGLKSVAP